MSVQLRCKVFLSKLQVGSHKSWCKKDGTYHLYRNADDELIYKGVVYNEMRGAFSQADSELYRLFGTNVIPRYRL